MGFRQSKVLKHGEIKQGIQPFNSYERKLSSDFPVNPQLLFPEPTSSSTEREMRERDSLKSVLILTSMGDTRVGNAPTYGALVSRNVISKMVRDPSYSPWYETPFYRKLRGNKPIEEEPASSTECESTDEDLMYNMMGCPTTGPSSDTEEDFAFAMKYLPDKSPYELEEEAKEAAERAKAEANPEAAGKPPTQGDPKAVPAAGKPPTEEDDLEVDLDDDTFYDDPDGDSEKEGVNQWAKMIEDDMKPVSDDEREFKVWDEGD